MNLGKVRESITEKDLREENDKMSNHLKKYDEHVHCELSSEIFF